MSMILFSLFWMWVIVLGFKGVMRRIGQLARWLCTPSGESSYGASQLRANDAGYGAPQLRGNGGGIGFPQLRGTVGQAWNADDYRRYSSLAATTPTPTIPDVVQGMQQALDQEKRTADELTRNIADWQHAIQQLRLSVDDWTNKAAQALAAGRQELARAAIAERQRAQQRIGQLENDVAQMQHLLTGHASDIQNLETQLSAIYRRNHIVETRLSAAESSARTRQLLYGEEVKDALGRFEALERAADLAEGNADALALGAPAPTAPDFSAIDAELEALRPAAGFGRKVTPAITAADPSEVTAAALQPTSDVQAQYVPPEAPSAVAASAPGPPAVASAAPAGTDLEALPRVAPAPAPGGVGIAPAAPPSPPLDAATLAAEIDALRQPGGFGRKTAAS